MTTQMARCNRERITERQSPAGTSGAFGRLEVTSDVSRYTKAALFQPGITTRLVIRFSAVARERGPQSARRNPRTFAIRFYTTDGSYDLVGSDAPVFLVKDPIHFQNFIRSQKRLASVSLRSNDMQWDFWTLLPETAHQVVWLMADRGLPKAWRHMNLYVGRTCLWVNPRGDRFLVKYHLITDQGIEFWTRAEAGRPAAADRGHDDRDLHEAIERGEHPSWMLKAQIMPFEEARTYRFNPFDLTKVWPHGDYPLREIGRLTLDRNPADHDTWLEQADAQPDTVQLNTAQLNTGQLYTAVPGIGANPDRMLLARLWGLVRAACVKQAEDDDWSQAGALVRDVLDDAARDRLVGNIVTALLDGVTEPVLQRAFWYLGNVDQNLGARVEQGVRDGQRRS